MQHFYDGQIRRYLTQTIRVFSNFVVKYADGTLHRVPVMYGDPDRQVASILRGNSENKTNSVPKIAVYVSGLDIDKDRLADPSFVSKVHIRERDVENGAYTSTQGKNYTVERLMPTPFKLTMKIDIWSANTDQKLQILEQILVLFNPSLELQTNSNYIDWTALSVLNLNTINWSSRSVPVGTDSANDIATLTVDTPIWISPPAKVKHLGVITRIITSMYAGGTADAGGYVDGLGYDLGGGGVTMGELIDTVVTTIDGFDIEVYNGQAVMMGVNASSIPSLEKSTIIGTVENWKVLFAQYPGKYVAGSSQLFLIQPDGSEVSGTFAINEMDSTLLQVNWDDHTFPEDDLIDPVDPQGRRSNGASAGTFDAIIDPSKVYPNHGMQNVVPGDRFLIIDDIPHETTAWGVFVDRDGNPTNAMANDIIEWKNDDLWHVIFAANQESSTHIYQTNIYNGIRVQYLWNGVQWKKSFEGDYRAGSWRIVL
jgi:hypothetical protein